MIDLRIGKKVINPKTGKEEIVFISGECDLILTPLKTFEKVEGVEKLKQLILKILLTPKGTNLDDPAYGTELWRQIGEKFTTLTVNFIRTEVYEALSYYNFLNAENPNLDERIDKIEDFIVEPDKTDPRRIIIEFLLITEGGTKVPFAARLKI